MKNLIFRILISIPSVIAKSCSHYLGWKAYLTAYILTLSEALHLLSDIMP